MSEPRTILIVDDDPDYADAIQHLFEREGDTVLRAANGIDGFALARDARPDVILLDVMMNERTEGFFTLERLKADPMVRDIPVIVVSSIYAEVPNFRVDPRAGWLPAAAFLAKPVDPQALLDEVGRVLAGAAAAGATGSTQR
jgi:twitching motility two-component system response regulator PilH